MTDLTADVPGHRGALTLHPLADPIPPGLGDCYDKALEWVRRHYNAMPAPLFDRHKMKLVHGSIEGDGAPRIGHAWVTFSALDNEGPRRYVHDPSVGLTMRVSEWNAWARAQVARTYTVEAMARKAVETDHSGPWHSTPFGLDDCPHGLDPKPVEHLSGGHRSGKSLVCPHGCTTENHRRSRPNPPIHSNPSTQ